MRPSGCPQIVSAPKLHPQPPGSHRHDGAPSSHGGGNGPATRVGDSEGHIKMDAIVSMAGRIGTDVDSKISRNGNKYVQFRMATSQRLFKDGQWVDGPTSWVSVRCYRQLGSNAALSLRKGNPVVVVGRLKVDQWVTDAGTPRETVYLDAQALGHDLNWGITHYYRLEKERFERAVEDEDVEPPEDRQTVESERERSVDRAEEHDQDLAEAEALMATIGEPAGAAG